MPTPLRNYKTWITHVDNYWRPRLENDPDCDSSCLEKYNGRINSFISLCDSLVAPKLYADAILLIANIHDLKFNTDLYDRYPDLPSVDDLFDDFEHIIPMTYYELTDDIENLFEVKQTFFGAYLDTTNFDNILDEIQNAQDQAGDKLNAFLQNAGGRLHDIMMSVKFGNLAYQEKKVKINFDTMKYFKLGRLNTYYPYVIK